ncbi:hypothetical protein SM100_002575 [Cronobacter sakazakii]|nr:hypothetical protein [Cronobacter sakazakii]ELY4813786.1 hypothetical protein [Cronobacter sakazakii]
MSEISKERAQEIFLGNGPEPTVAEERELARIALDWLAMREILDGVPQEAIDGGWTARGLSDYAKQLETELAALRERAEPVAYADPQAFRNFQAGTATKEWMWARPDAGLVPVFVEAPLAPVVPDECSFDGLDKDSKDYEVARMVGQVEGWNAFRAAMLQPVSAPYQLPGKEG